jgi:sialidase-1
MARPLRGDLGVRTGAPAAWARCAAAAAIAATGACTAPGPATGGPSAVPVDVFVGGTAGHAVYRIPSAVRAPDGSILAFAEARGSFDDIGENSLVMRRSADDGRTWVAQRTVASMPGRSLNNPCAVAVALGPAAGSVLLVFQSYPAGAREAQVPPGLEGDGVCRTHVTASADGGATWDAPRDITRGVKRPAPVTTTASGPGLGIQLARGAHAGRIVVPMNQGPYGDWRVYMALSDDGGASWRMGAVAPEDGAGHANEVQVAERADGTLLLAARQFGGGARRKVAVSGDGGETWGALRAVRELTDPSCMGGLLALDGGRRLAVTGPDDPARRRNGVAWISEDGGATWPVRVPVHGGEFAYSAPVALADGGLGVLFEADGCRRISFAAVPLPSPGAAVR